MKPRTIPILLIVFFCVIGQPFAQQKSQTNDKGWISLFNGENLDGWKVGENASSFTIVDGAIKIQGDVGHLFYNGGVEDHQFQNFEFKAKVKTKKGANSGIYIHTQYQDSGWPAHGYEVQVNNSHTDWKRTGSLYDIVDVKENYVQDDEWYTQYIKVEGNRVLVKINDTVVVDYTEPADPKRNEGSMRLLKGGTFALQAHDPNSIVFFKDIMVWPLP